MTTPLKILMLEDNLTDAWIIQRLLKKEIGNVEFSLVKDKEQFSQGLIDFKPDLILSDHTLPQFNSTEALAITRKIYPHIPFILITGTVSEEFAAEIIRQGADDYILKDRMGRLPAAINAAMKKRRAEKELVDYKYALDQSSIVAITDEKGIILYANDNFCKISRYSAEELVGKDHRIVNSGYHPKSYIKNLWDTIKAGQIWRGEFCNKAKNGSLYWVDATIIPFLNEEGKPYQYLAIRVDITERKKAEEKILNSESQYKDLLDNISDLICTHDLNGNVLSMNRAAEKLTGLKFNPQKTIKIKNYLLPDVRNEFDDYIAEIKKNGYAHGLMSVKILSGETRIWEYNNSLKTEGVNTPIVRGYARDITESRKAEKEILEMNEQLRQLSGYLQKVREEERTHMAREIHDELGQQLTVMKMDASWLNKKISADDTAIRQKIKDLLEMLDKTIKIVRRIASELRPSVLDDMGLLAAIEGHLKDFEKRSGIKTILKGIKEELPLPDVIKTSLFRIMQESLTNVGRYAKAKSVTVTLQHKDGTLVLTIQDDGVGFDKEKIASKKTLGLLGMKERTIMMGGTYEVNSKPGKGTTVIVSIPFNP